MKKNHSRILWIELIGFDNTLPDFGVENFLKNAGFVPDMVSLLVWTSEFILSHQEDSSERALTPEMCAYGARDHNEDRSRQNWSKSQLQNLISTLHASKIAVFFCVFDHVMPDNWYQRKQLEKPLRWIDAHPELIYCTSRMTRPDYLCPLKRLTEGEYYEDFFAKKLGQVLRDYSFDGFHAGDGYAHPRYPVWLADFSDDMINQFSEITKIFPPVELSYSQRVQWILTRYQKEWTEFYSLRQIQFWKKVLAILQKQGRRLIFNTAWTRDPFEAYYRYGVDYKALYQIGVTKFLVEAPAAVVEMEGSRQSNTHALDQYKAAFLMLKAFLPKADFCFINHIKDGNEGYNVLRHAPSRMLSDIFGMTELFYRKSPDCLTRCADGLMVCLADAIKKEEWTLLDSCWNTAFDGEPETGSGLTVVWSDNAFQNEVKQACRKNQVSSFQLLHSLISAGIPINTIVRAENATDPNALLLVLNKAFFSSPELERLRGCKFFVGRSDNENTEYLKQKDRGGLEKILEAKMPATSEMVDLPDSWLTELPTTFPSKEFFNAVKIHLQSETSFPFPVAEKQIKGVYSWFYPRPNQRILMIRNDSVEDTSIQFSWKASAPALLDMTMPKFPKKVKGVWEGDMTTYSIQLFSQTTTILKFIL